MVLTLPGDVFVVGDSVKYAAFGKLSDRTFPLMGVEWSATGGTIDAGGLYTAGHDTGTYTITAMVAGKALGEAKVVIMPKALAPADSVLASLRPTMVVYGLPDSLRVGMPRQVALVLLPPGDRASADSIRARLVGAGLRVGTDTARAGDRMAAHIWAPGIAVDQGDAGPLLSSPSQPTRWSWALIAESTGRQPISVTLRALVSMNGHDAAQPVFQLDTAIVAWKPFTRVVTGWLSNIWVQIWGALLTSIPVWKFLKWVWSAAQRRWQRRRSAPDSRGTVEP